MVADDVESMLGRWGS